MRDEDVEIASPAQGIQGSAELQTVILDGLIQRQSGYRLEALRFLNKFVIFEGSIMYFPNPSTRSKDSAVRNFLIELLVIQRNPGADSYCLAPNHVSLYALAKRHCAKIHPDSLTADLEAQDALGLDAELLVMQWERERLGHANAEKVEHVSIVNSAAGYDILSLNSVEEGAVPRYIEVKAVSPLTFAFYWSANEIRVASVLGPMYYLYLLPVLPNRMFSLASMRVIADPHMEIMGGSSSWAREVASYLCTPARIVTDGEQND